MFGKGGIGGVGVGRAGLERVGRIAGRELSHRTNQAAPTLFAPPALWKSIAERRTKLFRIPIRDLTQNKNVNEKAHRH